MEPCSQTTSLYVITIEQNGITILIDAIELIDVLVINFTIASTWCAENPRGLPFGGPFLCFDFGQINAYMLITLLRATVLQAYVEEK